MDVEERIVQFRRMVEADPENDLGHFSLARALLDAGRYSEAASELRRTLELNPRLSKAYYLLGYSLHRLGSAQEAIDVLRRGYEVADQRGDLGPREEIAQLLRTLGADLPGRQEAAPSGFRCRRCGAPGPQLEEPPIQDALGQSIYENVCAHCWQEWLAMGIKVINELRLDLSDPRGQQVFDHYMREFLNLPA
jgi:Fe-S cluster biosynthesis and repair protein YggX